jgi:hypothetical protein
MANEYNWSALIGNHSLCHRNITRQRDGRILNHRDRVSIVLQDLVNAFPPGSVHETAVD